MVNASPLTELGRCQATAGGLNHGFAGVKRSGWNRANLPLRGQFKGGYRVYPGFNQALT